VLIANDTASKVTTNFPLNLIKCSLHQQIFTNSTYITKGTDAYRLWDKAFEIIDDIWVTFKGGGYSGSI
jgi:hypothetical protein